jgi:hypothetical protein
MPVVINEQTYYMPADVCRVIGISINGLFRWLKEGIFSDMEYRDWRGWRIFTPAQLENIREKTSYVTAINREN